MSGTSPAIGIDLGTTSSCVAVWLQGKVEIIPCSQGNRTTPSYVAFTELERLIGDRAKHQGVRNPKNTIFNAKRIIGRRFDDLAVKKNVKRWPFTIINDASRPKFQVEFKKQKKILTPEEISAMVLTRMKETAEAYLGTNITDAVITVPASFNDSQRQATRNAGTIAGLNVLRIINEPTAAALAYGLDKNFRGMQNLLVFDLGGGNLDVSILRMSDGPLFEMLSTSGNSHLGGEDFDNRLLNHLVEEFKRTHGKDISGNVRAVRRLNIAAERTKRILSSSAEANIDLADLDSGIDFHTKVSRDKFEQLCLDLFRSTWIPVEKALVDAKLTASDINEIVLVGGSTRIPKIRSLLLNFFPGKQLNTSMNPDEAVAYGAAIQAARLTRSGLENVILKDITPSSLGVATTGGYMSQIIERNSRIPCSHSKVFSTHSDHQNRISVKVFEGDNIMVKDNEYLGKFELTGIPPLPKGVPQVEVRFNMDANGILNSWTTDISGNPKILDFTDDKSRLTKEEVKKMTEEAEGYREEDEKQKMRATARNNLEAYIFSVKRAAEEAGSRLSEREKKFCLRECEDALDWLDERTYEPEECEDELRIFSLKCAPVLEKLRDIASPSISAAGCNENNN